MTIILSASQKKSYEENGFLVIEHFIEHSIASLLMDRAHFLIDNYHPSNEKTIFSTNNDRHSKYRYFLDSGSKIHFFFEDGALEADGNLKYEKQRCINKIGHALHVLDPVFYCFSHSHKMAVLVEDLGIKNPLVIQSMYIFKQPFIGGEVTCHQDATYLYVEENPITGLWFALEDATLKNGCLWAIPGGHKTKLKSRLKRNALHEAFHETEDNTPWNLDNMVPLEVPKGSLIILHGLLPHMSKENVSNKSRHAYSLHVASADHDYPKDNWLQRPDDMPFKGFLS